MAKRKPTLTLVEMERELGYDFHSLAQPVDTTRRFYSDLRPVADSAYERIKKEFDEYQNKVNLKHNEGFSKKVLRKLDKTQVISHGQNRVILTQSSHVGFYRFAVDIYYGFGLHLPLLFTEDEACRTLSVAELQPYGTSEVSTMLYKLPREIRDKIYTFALSDAEWSMQNVDFFDRFNLTSSIGDPGGFYFPLSKNVEILSVNNQMRREALPLVYRITTFHLDDMDDLIKFLIAVGETGRDNIEALYFPWESRSDLECKWEENPYSDEHSLTLPNLHVMKCVQLLKQCKRLRLMRLYFESDLLENIAPEVFKADSGILELRSIQVEKLEIWSLGHESLEHSPLVHWLKKGMGCFGRSEGIEREA